MRMFTVIFAAIPLIAVAYLCADRLITSKNAPTAEQTTSVNKHVGALQARQRTGSKQIPRAVKGTMTVEVVKDSAQDDEEAVITRPTPTEAPDRAAELASTLDAEYEADGRQTPEAYEREKAITNIFSNANLGESGALQGIQCREKLCRGTIVISNQQADREVFEKTLLSTDFQKSVPDAISIASREMLSDGSVIATFFIHPQSLFAAIGD